jgi:hypothetical protein
MVWLPIVFVCLNSGQCAFVYETAQVDEQRCLKLVKEMGTDADKSPAVEGWYGSCVPVKFQEV